MTTPPTSGDPPLTTAIADTVLSPTVIVKVSSLAICGALGHRDDTVTVLSVLSWTLARHGACALAISAANDRTMTNSARFMASPGSPSRPQDCSPPRRGSLL